MDPRPVTQRGTVRAGLARGQHLAATVLLTLPLRPETKGQKSPKKYPRGEGQVQITVSRHPLFWRSTNGRRLDLPCYNAAADRRHIRRLLVHGSAEYLGKYSRGDNT
jgi:hypothetical protein